MQQNKKQNKTKYKVHKQSSSEAQAIFAMIQMEKKRKKTNYGFPYNHSDGLD